MSMTETAQPSYRSTRGRVPIFRPALNGQEFDVTFKEAAFILSESTHDIAILSCSSPTLTTTDGILDSTLSFYFGQAPRTELFCGYIVNIKEDEAGKGILTFTISVFGATQPMQKGHPRFWRKKTVPSAVESLCNNNNLGFYGHPHSHLWGAITQTSESDWQISRQDSQSPGLVTVQQIRRGDVCRSRSADAAARGLHQASLGGQAGGLRYHRGTSADRVLS